MNEVTEGLGGVVEGALVGGAVEPARGRISGDPAQTVTCANCGTVFTGNYCPNCGQKAHLHRTLTAIGHDLVHGVLHIDGKLSRTLPLLAFKPGRLTRRYIEGERASFVSPMSMFLFSVFAMFAVFQMVGLSTPTNLDFGGTAERIRTDSEAQVEKMRAEIASLDENDPLRAHRQREVEVIESFLGDKPSESAAETEAAAGTGDAQGEIDLRNLRMNVTGIEEFDQGLVKKWRENPGLMLYKLQANGYKFSWLLIPLSIPFVWLMFAWRRRFKAYDHAIFVTYSLAFMSLLFITLSLLNAAGLSLGWTFGLFAIAAPLHLYKHLRYSYGLSRFSTLWRFFALQVFMLIVLLLFLQALLLLGGF
ncbi:DUF3667 domain-containing protein [Erythrobacter sp.]|uniref:DUF3667 domain-containing protein n=1 Tax=Erythrobacter sp. TaxID=1042 RepID=UPI001425FC90|nr:DUF3667 domain-containing protein [Erythrobacter sp.]QIQ87822.1 MAG: DUF3667 domain-containing protein [Erythrobacter sp.]